MVSRPLQLTLFVARKAVTILAILCLAIVLGGCTGDAAPSDNSPVDPGADASDNTDTNRPGDVGGYFDASGDTGTSSDAGRDAAGGDVGTKGWRAPNVCEPLVEPVRANTADHVVGNGSVASCNEDALRQAIERGGTIAFDCGGEATIALRSPLQIRRDIALIGEGNITLTADGRHRLALLLGSDRGERDPPRLRIQGMELTGGRATAESPPPNLETYAGRGGAIFNRGGELHIVDSYLHDNTGLARGAQHAGGAIYSAHGVSTLVDGSYLQANTASNGGAIGQYRTDLEIADTVIADNQATGTGGDTGDGGNGGGISMTGGGATLSLCGTILENNQASAYGGGLYRAAPELTPTTQIRRSAIRDNNVYETDPSLGGGLYLRGTAIDIARTSITANRSGGAGGLYAGARTSIEMLNTTVATNVAARGLGGGLSVSPETAGQLRHVTIANNKAENTTGFAAGIHNGGRLTLQNAIIAGHSAGNTYSPLSCQPGLQSGAGSLQFPKTRPNGATDAACAPEITFADPMLGSLTQTDGVGRALVPSPNSPAIGFAADCPDLDQRGHPRAMPCTAGAIEVDR